MEDKKYFMKKKISNKEILTFYKFKNITKKSFPLLFTYIPAGFPSPADDYMENNLDLNEYLVKHPTATFFVKVEGDSMIEAGINSGDILVVDRAAPRNNNVIVVAILNGEFTVKRITKNNDGIYLISENKNYPPIKITKEMDLEIWGVVTYAIHAVK